MKLQYVFKLLDSHPSHGSTQGGQAKSCHKGYCLKNAWILNHAIVVLTPISLYSKLMEDLPVEICVRVSVVCLSRKEITFCMNVLSSILLRDIYI